MDLFKGRVVTIATKHKKERVIGPLLNRYLKTEYVVPHNFDTDIFGTFSGKVERQHSSLDTARNKCLEAIRFTGCEIAIASEGSFGIHSSLPFVTSNEELVMFMDIKNGLEVYESEISTSTNHAFSVIRNISNLEEFAKRVMFPSHGVIIKAGQEIIKGINDWTKLKSTFQRLNSEYEIVEVSTDMRANYNPSRMEVIGKAADKLMLRLTNLCPECRSPGFGIIGIEKGLPCLQCNMPTTGIKTQIYGCVNCDYKHEKVDERYKYEDPQYCSYCNP
ncbi:DUF6671 family protein [Marinigracilibium pacificum]|uniref:DUF6671 domain-containing protein n=1 Tax=Marinigracilibium pacificum TaxID=2729599 RepID=A0A848ISJ5_9BACT|nr:DUF6671 family protein [Marinigracilibium pacificum]NMM47413.1 hypothetical protein [Marinigracilibium pacificum]